MSADEDGRRTGTPCDFGRRPLWMVADVAADRLVTAPVEADVEGLGHDRGVRPATTSSATACY
jgi:hypothetical protein